MTSPQPQMRYDPRWSLDADSERYRAFILEQEGRFFDHLRALASEPKEPDPVPAQELAPETAPQTEPRERDVLDLGAMRGGPGGRPTVGQINAGVAKKHGISVAELKSKRRLERLVRARHEAISLAASTYPELSLPTIGRLYGLDHTTVLHAIRRHEQRKSEISIEDVQ